MARLTIYVTEEEKTYVKDKPQGFVRSLIVEKFKEHTVENLQRKIDGIL